MNKPKPFVRVIKLVKYFLSSIKMISIIQNWFIMPLGVFGIWDFSKGEILKLKNGLKFFAMDYMDGWTINEVFGDNDYKIHFSNKSATIIDIGANIGTFSIFAAYKMPYAKILSYEPGRKAFLQLRENILLNEMDGRVFPNKLAVYKNKSSIKLYDSGRTGLGSVYRVRGEKKFEVVPTTTLEGIFIKNKIKVCDYLKIDCEGAEYEILSS
ncbi:MAG: FkbM family methyltransferase, partial [Candidatus Woesebacteria bacterium]|nr:FkbM family methyltransferase [Candidatus Woesebacteria bacterium]